MKKPALLLFLVFLLTTVSFGQNKAAPDNSLKIGVVDNIHSIELGENRILNIYLPEGYSENPSLTYPVIYLLDGSINEDLIHVVGIVQFLTMIEKMPKSIVVGIVNIDRKRDFTFPTTISQDKKDFPTTGSSFRFMDFIEKELQPFIQKKYKTNSSKTIIGQSFGGLLATEVLLKRPDLFDHYIIISPSLWWDNESLLAQAPPLLAKRTDSNIKVYLSVGTEGEQMENDAKKLAEVLQSSAKANLKIIFEPLPKENHLTILHNSVYKGFESLNAK